MNLTKLSLEKKTATFVLVLLMVMFGFYAYLSMPVDLLPAMNYPTITIITLYPGATPQQVDTGISKHIADAVAGVNGVKKVESSSYNSASVIICELDYAVDLKESREKLTEKIHEIADRFPDGAETPTVSIVDVSGVPIVTLSVSGEKSHKELSQYLMENLLPDLEKLSSVSHIEIAGELQEEIAVLLNPYQMSRYNIAQTDVTYGLSMLNASIPLGETASEGRTVSVISDNVIDTIERLKTIPIKPLVGGNPVLLSDIARVEIAEGKNEIRSTHNSNPNIMVSIHKRSDASALVAAEDILKVAQQHNVSKQGITLTVVDNQADFITMSLGNVWSSLVIGGVLAIGILLFFLRSFKTAGIIGIAIPTSVIGTIGLMHVIGTPLNIISLGGLAIGVGMVVDNAIVVLESIYKVREEQPDLTPHQAALEGCAQVVGAIFASTLTTIAVFLPVSLVEGFTKEVFSQLSTTITFSLISSFVVAISVVPLLSTLLIATENQHSMARKVGKLFLYCEKGYERVVDQTLKKPRITLLFGFSIFLLSISLLSVVGTEFMPPMDQGKIKFHLEVENGRSMEDLLEQVYSIEEIIYKNPYIQYLSTDYGSLERGKTAIKMTAKLIPMERRPQVSSVAEEIRQSLQPLGLSIQVTEVKDLMNAMFGDIGSIGSPVAIGVSGENREELQKNVAKVRQVVTKTAGVINVTSSLDATTKEIKIKVKEREAAALGLSPLMIATYVRSALEGSVPLKVYADNRELDVRVKFDDRYVDTLQKIKQLQLKSYLSFDPNILKDLSSLAVATAQLPVESSISLSAVAGFEEQETQSVITKKGGKHYSEISAFTVGRTGGDVNQEIKSALAELGLMEQVSFGGQQSLFAESFEGLSIALIASIILVYTIMAVQFNSVVNPLIIMLSLPMAFTGSFLGLVLLKQSLNVCSFIGLIMLVGIVVNNAIVLIDRILFLMGEGMDKKTAILYASSSRMRPILMTALTTILGLLPLIVITGEGTELMRPMAVVVVGGMITSTMLSLVIIPALYHLFGGCPHHCYEGTKKS